MKALMLFLMLILCYNTSSAQKREFNKYEVKQPLTIEYFQTVGATIGIESEGFANGGVNADQTIYMAVAEGFMKFSNSIILGGLANFKYHQPINGDGFISVTLAPAFGVHFGKLDAFQVYFFSHIGPSEFSYDGKSDYTIDAGMHLALGYNKIIAEFSSNFFGGVNYNGVTVKIRI